MATKKKASGKKKPKKK